MRTSALLVALVFSFVATVSPAGAKTAHSAPQSAIDAALQQKVATGAADRETVLRLLDRPEVQAVAGNAGLDLRRAKDAVSTIDGPELTQLSRARDGVAVLGRARRFGPVVRAPG